MYDIKCQYKIPADLVAKNGYHNIQNSEFRLGFNERPD